MLDRPLAVDDPQERARFRLNAPVRCAHCKAEHDGADLIALRNAFLADRLLLATICPRCAGWSVVRGNCTLREPNDHEKREIRGDARCTKLYVEHEIIRVGTPD